MKYNRLHWDAVIGWIIDLPTTITDSQIEHISKWAVPRQVQRYNSLSIGSKKDELEKAIELLRASKITQRLIDDDHDGIFVPFKSTEKLTTKEYI